MYTITGTASNLKLPPIKISPNPVVSKLLITGPVESEFSISGIDGNIILGNIKSNTETDVSFLKPGIYFVHSEGVGLVGKIVKK